MPFPTYEIANRNLLRPLQPIPCCILSKCRCISKSPMEANAPELSSLSRLINLCRTFLCMAPDVAFFLFCLDYLSMLSNALYPPPSKPLCQPYVSDRTVFSPNELYSDRPCARVEPHSAQGVEFVWRLPPPNRLKPWTLLFPSLSRLTRRLAEPPFNSSSPPFVHFSPPPYAPPFQIFCSTLSAHLPSFCIARRRTLFLLLN